MSGIVRLVFALFVTSVLGPLAFPAAPADEVSADLKAKVRQLVEQLSDKGADKQAAAEAALLKLGPDILPLLPATGQNKKLHSIRSTLRDAEIQRDLAPRPVTMKDQAIPLSKALEALAKQTGIEVADRRQNKEDDPKLKLDLGKAPFWQALDTITREADVRLNLYQKDGKIAVVDGPHKALPVSYSGMFRMVVKSLQVVRDLETDAHLCLIRLEIAWEPRFQPLFLEHRSASLEVKDDKGLALNAIEQGTGRWPVSRRLTVETDVILEAPRRAVNKIGLLKGNLALLGPSRMLTFTFDKLAKIDRRDSRKEQEQSQAGVTVRMREFAIEPEPRWKVTFLLEYPEDSPDFESFESWLVNSQIYLERKSGKERLPPGGSETDDQGGHRAVATYYFVEDDKVKLGKPDDWRLVYKLPGTIAKVPVKFQFKDLTLP